METPNDLRAKFAAIATALDCSFEYGNSERILNRQSSQLTYPLIWLEVPDIRMARSGGLKRVFASAFTVLSNAEIDDYTGQDAALDLTFLITENVIKHLSLGADGGEFEFAPERCQSQYKGKWSADDDWGWRTEFDLTGVACENLDCDC